ncbi:MAG TPA: PDZ domain-containing protein [Candidatus Faecousia intestinigallinarum]|nr:PDZ domain-containing protein [Candidatus Faecousia intestinigallinarum]
MKRNWALLALTHLAVALAAVAITLGVCVGNRPEESKLDKLEHLIQERYIGIDDVDLAAVEDAAANAMVEALGDRWSYYLDEASYQANMEASNNAYVGIGVTVSTQLKDGGMEVLAVEEGGPAQEAGILPQDVITAVEGALVSDLGWQEASGRIRGEEHTFVELTVLRGGEEQVLRVERRRVEEVVATGQMLENNIGLVTIRNFHSRCAQETVEAIENLRALGAEALIFDVRFNPGGYLTELVELLDYLLPEGVIFQGVEYTGEESVETSDENYLDMPMAVLMNGDSYSAAELFAATLKEYGVATLVGEPTVGKGRYQVVYPLGDGSAVGLSIGEYFTSQGVSLEQEGGLQPDVAVSVDEETYAQIAYGQLTPEEDPQMQAAIAALLGE